MLFKNDSCLRTVDGGLRRILYKFKERDRDVPCPEAPLGVNEFSPASQAHSLLHHHSGKGTGGVRIDGNVDLAFTQLVVQLCKYVQLRHQVDLLGKHQQIKDRCKSYILCMM